MTKQEYLKTTEKRLFPILYNVMRSTDTLSFLQDFSMYLRTEIEETYKCAERVGFREYVEKIRLSDCFPDVTENDKECAKYYDTLAHLQNVERDVNEWIDYLFKQFRGDYV